MIYLLFGEMGVGKNHVGELLASHLGCPFFDGDTVIPEDMMERIDRFKVLKPDMLDRYVWRHLIPAIWSRHAEGQDLVAAQALYRRRHRQMVLDGKGYLGEGLRGRVVPVWVDAPFLTVSRRLLGREDGFKWLLYSLACKPFFERPDKGTARIDNRTGLDLAGRFREIAGR